MKNNRLLIITFSFVITSIVIALFLYLDKRAPNIRDAMTFYPIDKSIQFEVGKTNLNKMSAHNNNEYTLNWSTYSTLQTEASLRHDFSLLYKNGILLEKTNNFTDRTKEITLREEIHSSEDGYFEAVTFHHAEVHYPDDTIKSRQLITSDELYVIDTPVTPLHAFKEPKTLEETSGKNNLDKIVYQHLNDVWKSLLKQYEINKEDYTIFTLTNIDQLLNESLNNYSLEQSEKIIAALTETFYSYYFFGIPNEDGSFISPIGSSLPIILIPNEGNDHLIILFRTENGKNIQLLKKFSF